MTAQDLPATPATAGASVTALSHRLVADLVRRWDHAVAYLLLDGRLRCTAAAGPFPVPDGVAPGLDAAGRAVASCRTVVDDPESTGPALWRVCAPVVVDGAGLGVVEVAGRSPLPAEAVADAESAAGELVGAMTRPGASAAAPLGQRLARLAVEVARARDAERLVRDVLEGATALSGRPSAALAVVSPGGRWRLHSATGPLAQTISGWSTGDVLALARQLPVSGSVHLSGRPDGPAGLGFLPASGVACASVHPLVVGGALTGLLVVADAELRPQDPVASAAVEVLAALAAAGLRSAALLADLADRAREALTGVRTVEDFRDDLIETCIDAIRSGEVTHTCMRLRLDAAGAVAVDAPADPTTGLLVEALTGQLRHGDRLYRLDASDFAILLATGEPDSAGAVATRLVRAAREAGAPVTLGWALVDGPPAVVGAATDQALHTAAQG